MLLAGIQLSALSVYMGVWESDSGSYMESAKYLTKNMVYLLHIVLLNVSGILEKTYKEKVLPDKGLNFLLAVKNILCYRPC